MAYTQPFGYERNWGFGNPLDFNLNAFANAAAAPQPTANLTPTLPLLPDSGGQGGAPGLNQISQGPAASGTPLQQAMAEKANADAFRSWVSPLTDVKAAINQKSLAPLAKAIPATLASLAPPTAGLATLAGLVGLGRSALADRNLGIEMDRAKSLPMGWTGSPKNAPKGYSVAVANPGDYGGPTARGDRNEEVYTNPGDTSGRVAGFNPGSQEGQQSIDNNGGCFLTTAACREMGEADDGPTLRSFRCFRDNVLAMSPAGREIIARYYRLAPRIVEGIDRRVDAPILWRRMYVKRLLPLRELIRQERFSPVLQGYVALVREAAAEAGMEDLP